MGKKLLRKTVFLRFVFIWHTKGKRLVRPTATSIIAAAVAYVIQKIIVIGKTPWTARKYQERGEKIPVTILSV